jgi:hypothetical protein
MKLVGQLRSLALADLPRFLMCILLVPASLVAIMVFRLFDQNIVALGGAWLVSCSYFVSISTKASEMVAPEERSGKRLDVLLGMVFLADALWLAAAAVSLAVVLTIWTELVDRAVTLASIALVLGVATGVLHWVKARAEWGPLP